MKYAEIADDICNELQRFQDFLYRHFYKHLHCEEMRPRSNEHGRFFATIKSHKFESTSDITLEQLKLRRVKVILQKVNFQKNC